MPKSELYHSLYERKFICPCCINEKTLRETPLLNIFRGEYYKRCYYKNITEELDKDVILTRCIKFLDWASIIHKRRKAHPTAHTNLWACITCIQSKRAEVSEFTKQTQGFGIRLLMYIRQTYNCDTCKVDFNFEPKEQKFWYEKLKFIQESRPRHCQSCRAEIREIKKAQKQLMQLIPKGPNFSIDELKQLIGYYKTIGADKKQLEFKNRLKNKEKYNR